MYLALKVTLNLRVNENYIIAVFIHVNINYFIRGNLCKLGHTLRNQWVDNIVYNTGATDLISHKLINMLPDYERESILAATLHQS